MIHPKSLSGEEYRALPGASHSTLVQLDRSPAACRLYMDTKRDQTPAMARGEAFHAMLLEPETFPARFALKDYDGRTKDGKARKEEIESKGLIALPVDDWDAVHHAVASVRSHPLALRLVSESKMLETSLTWDTDLGPCRGRIDGYTVIGNRGVLWDLKWSTGAHPKAFTRECFNRDIHSQLAFYRDGLLANDIKVDDCVVIAIEADGPYEVYLYRLLEQALEDGGRRNARRLETFNACMESGAWQGGMEQVIDLGLPKWIKEEVLS